ncbi:MAG: hypothetical protein GEV10_19895 [Streptosporangiales bacterium]|nr:hypothetical protein [Streptosporangiales bacterium]
MTQGPGQPPARPRPLVDPAELRPRRRMYWVGLSIFTVTLVVGITVGVVLVKGFVANTRDFQGLTNGAPSTVSLPAGDEKILYAAGGDVEPFDEPPDCEFDGPGDVRLTDLHGSSTLELEDEVWSGIAGIHVSAAGDYTVTCPASGDVRYGIGNRIGGMLAQGFGAAGAFLVLPGIGFVVGGTIALVTLVGRNGHRNRILRQRTPKP